MGETKQTTAGALREGGYVLLGDIPCVIKSIQKGKTGKHGAAKCRIEGIGLIDGQKKIEIHPAGDPMLVPIVEKKNAQVLSVQGDTANVMDNESYETFDIKIPEDLKGQVEEGSQIMYWIIMDQKVIKSK